MAITLAFFVLEPSIMASDSTGEKQRMLETSLEYGTSSSPNGSSKSEVVTREHKITVEPIMLLYQLGVSSLRTTTEQFAYDRFLSEWDGNDAGNSTDDISIGCGDIMKQQELDAQAQTAKFLVAYDLALLLPGILLAFWVGSYTDRYGRKLMMLTPLLGIIVRALCSFLVADFEWSVYVLFVGVLCDALSGGPCVFSTTVYAYIADISGIGSR